MKYEELTEEERRLAWYQIEPYLYDEEDEPDIDQLIKAIMDEKIPILRWTGDISTHYSI